MDAFLRNGQFQINKWHWSNKKVDQTDEEHVDFLGKKWNKARDTISFKKTEIVTWPSFGIPQASWLQQPSRWELIYKNCGVSCYSWDEVLPDEIQTKLKKMSKYSTNVVSTNTKES